MKIIDLLNIIAHGEKIPKKIKVISGTYKDEYRVWIWNDFCYEYLNDPDAEVLISFNKLDLSDLIEVLEYE